MTPRDKAEIGLSAIFHGQIQKGGGDHMCHRFPP